MSDQSPSAQAGLPAAPRFEQSLATAQAAATLTDALAFAAAHPDEPSRALGYVLGAMAAAVRTLGAKS